MSKKIYITYLNVLSTLAVVILHTNHIFWAFSKERYWISANILESLFYFAVPIFFMITGATLIGYSQKYNTTAYFTKRIQKTVFPYFIWTLFAKLYLLYDQSQLTTRTFIILVTSVCFLLIGSYFAYHSQQNLRTIATCLIVNLLITIIALILTDSNSSLSVIIQRLINTEYLPSYWFFIPLYACYLAIPLLETYLFYLSEKKLQLLLVITFLINFCYPFFTQVIGIAYNANLVVPLLSSYLWYCLAGYYFDKYPINSKVRSLLYVLGFIGLATHLLGTWYLSYRYNTISYLFKGYLNVPTICYTLAIFIWVKYNSALFSPKLFTPLFKKIAPYTFGVYLIHWFVIQQTEKYFIIDEKSFWFRTLGGLSIFIASITLVKLVKKLPFGYLVIP